MQYVKRGNTFMPKLSIKQLETMYKEEKNTKAKLRILCAIHRKENKTIMEISQMTRLPKSTISDYLRRLEDKNLFHDIKNKGAIPKLANEQQKELISVLSDSPNKVNLPFVFWTTKLVQYYIKRQFKKEFTLYGVRKLLYRFGFTLQKPRQTHYKTNEEEQRKFKKTSDEELEDMLRKDTKSFFWMRAPSP